MKRVAITLLALFLLGCATPSSRIDSHPEIFSQATPEQQAMIRQGRVGVGFTPEFVTLAMGDPDGISEREDASGVETIWHYREFPTYSDVNAGFGYGYGYGGPWYWGGGIGFVPVAVVDAPAGDADRLRVVFKANRAITVERVVKKS